MNREAGPGMPRGVRRETQPPPPVWWYDYGTGEIVRTRDGRRWDTRDVPEMARSSRDMNACDVDKVDRWVLAQPDEP